MSTRRRRRSAYTPGGGAPSVDILYNYSVTPLITETEASQDISIRTVTTGSVYFAHYEATDSQPSTGAAIVAASGATWSDSVLVSSIDSYSDPVTDLSPGIEYIGYAVWYDGVSEYSNIVSYEYTTQGSAMNGAELLQSLWGTSTDGLWFSGVDKTLVIADSVGSLDYSGDYATKFSITGAPSNDASGITIAGSNYISIAGTNFVRNDNAMSVLIDATPVFSDSGITYEYMYVVCYIGASEYLRVYCATSGGKTGDLSVGLRDNVGGAVLLDTGGDSALVSGQRHKIAIAWDTATLKFSFNGGTVQSTTAPTAGPTLSGTWHIGHGSSTGTAGSIPINGKLRSLVILPEKLSDANLQAWGA
jgi:hypothetical protein